MEKKESHVLSKFLVIFLGISTILLMQIYQEDINAVILLFILFFILVGTLFIFIEGKGIKILVSIVILIVGGSIFVGDLSLPNFSEWDLYANNDDNNNTTDGGSNNTFEPNFINNDAPLFAFSYYETELQLFEKWYSHGEVKNYRTAIDYENGLFAFATSSNNTAGIDLIIIYDVYMEKFFHVESDILYCFDKENFGDFNFALKGDHLYINPGCHRAGIYDINYRTNTVNRMRSLPETVNAMTATEDYLLVETTLETGKSSLKALDYDTLIMADLLQYFEADFTYKIDVLDNNYIVCFVDSLDNKFKTYFINQDGSIMRKLYTTDDPHYFHIVDDVIIIVSQDDPDYVVFTYFTSSGVKYNEESFFTSSVYPLNAPITSDDNYFYFGGESVDTPKAVTRDFEIHYSNQVQLDRDQVPQEEGFPCFISGIVVVWDDVDYTVFNSEGVYSVLLNND